MPSAKILEAKKAYVAELNTKIAGSLAGVVVAYNGISVADDTKMRKELREAGVEYMVVKTPCCAVLLLAPSTKLLLSTSRVIPQLLCLLRTWLLLPASCARLLTQTSPSASLLRVASATARCWMPLASRGLSTMPNREGLLSMLAGSLNGIIGGLAVAIQGIVDKQEETPLPDLSCSMRKAA